MIVDKLPNLFEPLAPNMISRTKAHSSLADFTEQVGRSMGPGTWKVGVSATSRVTIIITRVTVMRLS